jgi:hypothetical protein
VREYKKRSDNKKVKTDEMLSLCYKYCSFTENKTIQINSLSEEETLAKKFWLLSRIEIILFLVNPLVFLELPLVVKYIEDS